MGRSLVQWLACEFFFVRDWKFLLTSAGACTLVGTYACISADQKFTKHFSPVVLFWFTNQMLKLKYHAITCCVHSYATTILDINIGRHATVTCSNYNTAPNVITSANRYLPTCCSRQNCHKKKFCIALSTLYKLIFVGDLSGTSSVLRMNIWTTVVSLELWEIYP